MDFKHCPSFAFADHALLELQADGTWSGVDGDGIKVGFTDGQMAGALPLSVDQGGKGLYAVMDGLRGGEIRRFSPDYANGIVHVEGAGRPMAAEEFFRNAVRTDRDGKAVCSFLQPLHEQYSLCREVPGGDAHCMDIADAAEARRNSETAAEKVNVGLYDAVSSGISDGLTFMELIGKVTARSGRPVHDCFGLAETLPGQWAEIREFPQYMMGAVRALFGSYMDERIGGFPLERVSRLHAEPGTPLAMKIEEIAELVSSDEPFDGGNVVRGYRTSPVGHYRGEGFDAIVFSDFAGTYAYAWPTPPEAVAAPRGPAA